MQESYNLIHNWSGSKTRYRQLQYRTNTYSQTFFPSTICFWNTPVDVCQLPPDSFKARLNTILLMWMAPALFLIHLAPLHRFYLLNCSQHHSVPLFHVTHLYPLRGAILLYLSPSWHPVGRRRRISFQPWKFGFQISANPGFGAGKWPG